MADDTRNAIIINIETSGEVPAAVVVVALSGGASC